MYRTIVHWKDPDSRDGVDLPSHHEVRFMGRADCSVQVSDTEQDRQHANPQELLLAAFSSSQMLTYISLCARSGIPIVEYHDSAFIYMDESVLGQPRVERIVLQPRLSFDTDDTLEMRGRVIRLINEALSLSWLANSLRARVAIDPTLEFLRRP